MSRGQEERIVLIYLETYADKRRGKVQDIGVEDRK